MNFKTLRINLLYEAISNGLSVVIGSIEFILYTILLSIHINLFTQGNGVLNTFIYAVDSR